MNLEDSHREHTKLENKLIQMESDRTIGGQTTEESEDRERIQSTKKLFSSRKTEKPLLNAVLNPNSPAAKKFKKKETR